jgi:protein-tyrosine phosphatase
VAGLNAPLKPARHFNLRDLGGLRAADGRVVGAGRLYRGAGLHRLTGDDLEFVRTLRLRLVVDLRSTGELNRHGGFPHPGAAAAVRHLPMFETLPALSEAPQEPAERLSELYSGMLDVGGRTIATVVKALAQPANLPMLFYCAAGKDRTGVTAALVLRLLGVSNEAIAADYAASEEPVRALLQWMETGDSEAHEEMVRLPRGMTSAPPTAIRGFLESVEREHASVERFVEGLGVDRATIEAVQRNLLVHSTWKGF